MRSFILSSYSVILLGLVSCGGGEVVAPDEGNSVLMLQVDYETLAFEGGIELHFDDTSSSFTVTHEYVEPGDFGSIKLLYQEINAPLFFGTIHWMGLGERIFPAAILPKDSFEYVLTNDFVNPAGGFQELFNPGSIAYDLMGPWPSVQALKKVREYLSGHPADVAKVFLYTPSVGSGDPADWDWIIFLKKNYK